MTGNNAGDYFDERSPQKRWGQKYISIRCRVKVRIPFNFILRYITTNTLVPCVLFSKFGKQSIMSHSGNFKKREEDEILKFTLGWNFPNKNVNSDINLNLILFNEDGSGNCAVHPTKSRKLCLE